MSLSFTGGDTDNVNFGSGSSIDNLTAWTIILWLYFNATGTPSRVVAQKGSFGGGNRNPDFYFDFAAATLSFNVDRATVDTSTVSSTTVPTGAWTCVAATYDGTDGGRIFQGSLTALLTENSYTVNTVGSGAIADNSAANLFVGGDGSGSNNSFNGNVDSVAVFNRRMALAELQSHQFNPRVENGCVLFTRLGFNGTGTQPDWSGNGNSGTVTGATAADPAPLMRPWRRPAIEVPYAVASAAFFNPYYYREQIARAV